MHHGNNDLSSYFNQFEGDAFRKSMPAPQRDRIGDLLSHMKEPKVGPTGNHPEGKLNDGDDGEIAIGVTGIEDRVIMHFGTPVKWVGFTKEQAVQVAESLIKFANR